MFLTLLGLTLLASTSQAKNAPTPYLDQIETLVGQAPKTIDELLAALPEDLKKQYMLIYGSRSLQSASLEKPRVVLFSPDRQLFVAFNDGHGPKLGDKEIEIIESRGVQAPQFARITWVKTKPQLIRNPQTCTSCHQGAPIFDEYPNWPGFYGSTDNGYYYGRGYGSGMMAKLEFEEAGLKEFQKVAPTLPNYRQLVDLQKLALDDLTVTNTMSDILIKAQLEQRQNHQIYQTLPDLEALETALISSYPYTPENYRNVNRSNAEPFLQAFLEEGRFADFRVFRSQNAKAYDDSRDEAAQDRFRRLSSLTNTYGTDQDRRIMSHTGFAPYFDRWSPYSTPYPVPRTDLGIPVPQMMNYFGREAVYRSANLFYTYWRGQHPELALEVPLTTEHPKRISRSTGGNTVAMVLSPYVVGFTNTGTTLGGTYSVAPLNHRSFDDLYDWVPLPLKQYTWDEVQAKPLVASRFNRIQKSYLEIIAHSPALRTSSPEIFLGLKSLSPENLEELKKIINKKTK